MISVTYQEHEDASRIALDATQSLWQSVDATCELTVSRRTNAHRHDKDDIRTITERSNEFTFHFTNLPPERPNATMRLCRVNGQGDPNRAAILSLADTEHYVRSDLTAFPSFLNKMTYAERTNTSLFLFIGALNQSILDERPGLPWMDACIEEPGNSMHHLKPIAFLALMNLMPMYEWFFFMDMDAWFNDGAFYSRNRFSAAAAVSTTPEEGVHLDAYFNIPQSHGPSLVGSQNRYTLGRRYPYTPIILNGGLLGLRNDEWSRKFSALWWQSRCGKHDQLGLWNNLFADWSAAVDKAHNNKRNEMQIIPRRAEKEQEQDQYAFQFNASSFANYYATKYVYQHLMRNTDDIRSATGLASYNIHNGGTIYKTTGTLSKGIPLELPNVLILPTSSMYALPALSSDNNTKSGPNSTFICHIKIKSSRERSGQRTAHCDETHVCKHGKCGRFWYS